MTTVETVFVVSAVLNIIQLLLIFVLFTNFIVIKIQIQQIHNGLGAVLNKLASLEQNTGKMAAGFTEFIKMTEDIVDRSDDMRIGQIYKTSDGKYSAKSLDDLINKIKNDGNQTEYFSDEEINKLRKMFEEDDDFDDEEDII